MGRSYDSDASDVSAIRTATSRAMAELRLAACAEHYNEAVTIAVEDLSGGAKTQVRFNLQRAGRAAD